MIIIIITYHGPPLLGPGLAAAEAQQAAVLAAQHSRDNLGQGGSGHLGIIMIIIRIIIIIIKLIIILSRYTDLGLAVL